MYIFKYIQSISINIDISLLKLANVGFSAILNPLKFHKIIRNYCQKSINLKLK